MSSERSTMRRDRFSVMREIEFCIMRGDGFLPNERR